MLANVPVYAMIPVVDMERAKSFYEGKLGLGPATMYGGDTVAYACGGGTRIGLYQRAPTKADHIVACFAVRDIETAVKELRAKGVQFEEYDFPGLKTVNGTATRDGEKAAWFKDAEGNILELSQRG